MQNPEFNVVSKASHYNRHPSGIEVKYVVRRLDFNLGCVFKYVVRREEKEHLRSLQSARFYLLDHLENWAECPTLYVFSRFEVQKLVQKFQEEEQNPVAKEFYGAFASLVSFPWESKYHGQVLAALDALIAEAP